jgi:hypothetical protein
MPIDYSKWDHLDYSDDDEGNADEAAAPRVTRLDCPSKVTFGGGDGSASIAPSNIGSTAKLSTSTSLATNTKASNVAIASSPTPNADSRDAYATWTTKGGSVVTSLDRKLFWCQDRYSVIIRLELISKEEKVQGIHAEGVVPYADRFCAVGTIKPQIRVQSTTGAVLLEGEVPHSIHYAQEEDEVEWSVERSCLDERFLAITFYKAVPTQGLSIWWRRPMMHFEEMEVEKQESSQTSQEFLQAWEEAHRLFREKKRSSG